MKKLLWSFMLLTAITSLAGANLQAEIKNKPLLGEWLYSVSDVPYGYEKGSLIFSEKEGKTICIIKVEAGELVATDLKIERKKITFTTTVEGSSINIALDRIKNKLIGKVDTPDGPKTLTAIKK